MALIQSPKASGGFERRQVVRLPKTGLYGGMLSQYSLPKNYNTKWGEKEQMVLRFVITHDQAYRQLPRFSGAFVKVTNVINEKSNLVGVLYALFGGKRSKLEIVEGDGIFDYDNFIGRPVSLFVKPDETPDNDGFYANRVNGIEPADAELLAAIKPLYAAKKIGKNEKTDLAYLVSPSEEYEDAPVVAQAASNDYNFPNSDDDIPF